LSLFGMDHQHRRNQRDKASESLALCASSSHAARSLSGSEFHQSIPARSSALGSRSEAWPLSMSATRPRSRPQTPGHPDSGGSRGSVARRSACRRQSAYQRSRGLSGLSRRCARRAGNRRRVGPARYPSGRYGAIVRGRSSRPADLSWLSPISVTSSCKSSGVNVRILITPWHHRTTI
jgi:hypothetical protein